jgi:hypothetical protein
MHKLRLLCCSAVGFLKSHKQGEQDMLYFFTFLSSFNADWCNVWRTKNYTFESFSHFNKNIDIWLFQKILANDLIVLTAPRLNSLLQNNKNILTIIKAFEWWNLIAVFLQSNTTADATETILTFTSREPHKKFKKIILSLTNHFSVAYFV